MEKNKYSFEDAPQSPEPNGWEEVAAMAGQMAPVINESPLVKSEKETQENEDEASQNTTSIPEFDKTSEIDHQIISRIDEYLMSGSEYPNMMARYVADLSGVAVGIKPAALVQITSVELSLEPTKLAELLQQSGLAIADGWSDGKFFIGKDLVTTQQVQEKFQKLWNGSLNDEENRELGRLLGYPETAAGIKRKQSKTLLNKIKNAFAPKVDPAMARYYVHTPEHQAEEFEQYERPLHKYMDKYCPKASAILKTERAENGKTYRWL